MAAAPGIRPGRAAVSEDGERVGEKEKETNGMERQSGWPRNGGGGQGRGKASDLAAAGLARHELECRESSRGPVAPG